MKKLLVVGIVVGIFNSAYAADSGAGINGLSFLASQNGVRAAAMGGAAVAVLNNIESMFNNPAGLPTLKYPEITAMSQDLQEDTSHQNAAFVIPLSRMTSQNVSSFGTFGGAFSYLDYGDFEGRTPSGVPTANFDARDYSWSVGYGKGWYEQLFVGVLYKRYNSRIAEEKVDGGVFDLGALYKLSTVWTLGVSIKNQGNHLNFVNGNEPLPRTTTVGLGYVPLKDVLSFALDLEKPKDLDTRTKMGVEWWAARTIALRGGYDTSDGVDGGFSVGAGIRILDLEALWYPIQQLSLDYAFLPGTDVSGVSGETVRNRQNFSISMRFGER